MGSGRGDRNQADDDRPIKETDLFASMGSGRGDRNQVSSPAAGSGTFPLQWGPVVVTGIRSAYWSAPTSSLIQLQWGPVVVTGIGRTPSGPASAQCALQWGPVVVTGIRRNSNLAAPPRSSSFNGVRSW